MGKTIVNFLKGIVAGFGGIAPGLSGTVLLIIMGLYRDVLDSLGSLFKDFKKKLVFLLPIVAGMVMGVLLFSNVLDYLLSAHEMATRFCFLGLILGAIPMLYREVKKEGVSPWHYVLILLSALAGLWLFTWKADSFRQIPEPNFFQSVILGVGVAASSIIPGIDPAVLLSTMGLYEAYVGALAALDLTILLPMVIGLAAGALIISFAMSWLFKRFYTVTFSIIFGMFLSMIPNILGDTGAYLSGGPWGVSVALLVLGLLVSFLLGDLDLTRKLFAKLFRKKR